MSDGSLRAKQEKLQLESKKMIHAELASHSEEGSLGENRKKEGANPEWQRFYEVIKEITQDMRY
ncbi:hypothetical protein [Paenibacillus sp. LPE1-1-1.1]|uniref:hypothetical protein n=1 Tax=Paenibacillus sp. LPE1-1-1.1 TaxID=3135230 RepID=UPI0034190EB7